MARGRAGLCVPPGAELTLRFLTTIESTVSCSRGLKTCVVRLCRATRTAMPSSHTVLCTVYVHVELKAVGLLLGTCALASSC